MRQTGNAARAVLEKEDFSTKKKEEWLDNMTEQVVSNQLNQNPKYFKQ